MKVGIPKEIYPHEARVAATPETVQKIIKLGFTVVVQAGAGDASALSDATYAEAGATIVPDAAALYAAADLVLKVRQPIAVPGGTTHEADMLKEGAQIISFLWPAQNARAAHGRAVGDGEHRRLPRGDRGGQPVRPLLPGADHRRRPRQAGAG